METPAAADVEPAPPDRLLAGLIATYARIEVQRQAIGRQLDVVLEELAALEDMAAALQTAIEMAKYGRH